MISASGDVTTRFDKNHLDEDISITYRGLNPTQIKSLPMVPINLRLLSRSPQEILEKKALLDKSRSSSSWPSSSSSSSSSELPTSIIDDDRQVLLMIVEEEIAQKLVDLENVRNFFSYHDEGGDTDHVEFLRLKHHDARSTEQSLRLMVEQEEEMMRVARLGLETKRVEQRRSVEYYHTLVNTPGDSETRTPPTNQLISSRRLRPISHDEMAGILSS